MNQQSYEELRAADIARDAELRQQSNRYTALRTTSFLGLIFAFAAGYDGHPVANLLGIGLLLLFISIVHRHRQLRETQRLLHSHLAVITSYLDRFSDQWHDSPENGTRYLQKDRPQQIDLHIFGPASLYQYLCAARTSRGRKRLAQALSPVPPAKTKIEARQLGVKDLLAQPRLCMDLEAQARLLPDHHDTTALITRLEQHDVYQHLSHGLQRSAGLLSILLLVSLLLASIDQLNWSIPGLLASLQFALTMIFFRRTQSILAPLDTLSHELYHYEALFAILEQADFTETTMIGLQQRLQAGQAAQSLHQLARLTERVSQRHNIFFFVTANTLALWDVHCVVPFIHWQERAAENLREWIDIWSEVEVLLSLTVIGHTRQICCFPQILDGPPKLNAQKLTSLLIPEASAIANDTTLSAESRIITGSNMSGKTTYIRTLASSAILAYAGAPVCARQFALTPLHIFTSIQVNDDMAHGISTFYAELLRIKQMVEFSRKKIPMLICIDEIFKGTNSADRIVGAQEAIRHLTLPWAVTIVTTHDFELCDLQSPNGIPVTNFHFEEFYENSEIRFDYTLKPGRCHTTNARYLLQMAGIMTDNNTIDE